jgi:hypothetical protein
MRETLGQRLCRMIVKNSRPTLGIGRPRSVTTGCTRRGDLNDAGLFGAGEKAARIVYN